MFLIKEVMQYHTNNGSVCYALLFDASKALNTIRYIKLFELHSSKGLCAMAAMFLGNFLFMTEC